MNRIIAGRFEAKGRADIVAALLADFVDSTDVCIFHNNPPGQHDRYEMGGDEAEDPGADGAGASAAKSAVAAGLAAGAIGSMAGPVVAIGAAAAAAYSASMGGAMAGLGTHDDPPSGPLRRPAGVILAVRIAHLENEDRVVAALRAAGAADIEQAQGEWRNGDWVDFDPVAAPQLLDFNRVKSTAVANGERT